jgi:hypothetical protein
MIVGVLLIAGVGGKKAGGLARAVDEANHKE